MAKEAKRPAAADVRQLQQLLQQAIGLHRGGQLDAADKAYTQVLKAVPNQPDALNLSGLIAHQQGKNARAVMLLNKAVAARPNFADALNHLGMAQRALGQTQAALVSLAAAVEADPQHAEAWNNLGNARKDAGDMFGATSAYETAVAGAPRAVEPKYNLANILLEAEQHGRAEALYKDVLSLNPAHVEARFNLAVIFERRHELESARDEVKRALAGRGQFSQANILLAKVLRRLKDFDGAEAALASLRAAELSTEDAIGLAVERGRLFDVTDRADEAFAAFTEANRLQAAQGGKKLAQQAEGFRRRPAGNLEWLERLEVWPEIEGNSGENLVFLVGFPRSGTTLLDQILDAHPGIAVVEERPTAVRMLAKAKDLGLELPKDVLGLDESVAEQLRAAYFDEVDRHVSREPGRIIVDKMPLNIVHVLPLTRIFPRAKFVIALRHPLDVILSCFMQRFRLNEAMSNFLSLDDAAETYDLTLRLWTAAEAKLPLQVHEVRYENLIADVEKESRALLDFLGADWTDAVLDPTGHARARKIINTPSYEQVTEPIYQRASGRWTRYEKHLEPVRKKLDPWVERFGYRI